MNSQKTFSPVQIILVSIVCLFIGLGGGFLLLKGSLYGQKDSNNQTAPYQKCGVTSVAKSPICSSPVKWIRPESIKKGYPILNPETNMLDIFLVDLKDLKNTNKKAVGGGGASGYGATDPVASPDLFFTAYIDKDTQQLNLLSHETFKEAILTPGEKVAYIFGWSPDSRKIIYSITSDTLATRREGPGGQWEGKEQFDSQRDPGFFVFDIVTGKKTKLSPIEYIESFIDGNRILVKARGEEYMSKRLIVFNLDTFEADYGLLKDEYGFGASQYSFPLNGLTWTYTYSKNPTNDANIIYADFPTKEGIEIDTGNWAEVQFPFISPQGTKVAYWKQEGYVTEGSPRYAVWIYNVETRTKERYGEGMMVRWVDENRLIYRIQNQSVSDSTFYLFDLKTRESIKMN